MTVHEQAPSLQIAALLEGTTNISLIRSIGAEHGLAQRAAWKEEVVVAMPRAHPFARRKRIALRDLAAEDHVVLQPESSDFAHYIQKCCIDAGFLPRVSQQVVDAQSVPSLIAAGFGVSLVPQSIARFTTEEIAFRPIRPLPTLGRRVSGLPQGRDIDGGAQFSLSGAPYPGARRRSFARDSIAAPIPATALKATMSTPRIIARGDKSAPS